MKLTPMLEQYFEIKRQVPDAILFYRLGDFYEMFFEDAEKAAPILDLVLTARSKGQEHETPMCGVPYHSADGYIAKLIRHGLRVAICEQTEDPAAAKGLVKREIVRIVTPGTATESFIVDRESCYLVALGWGVGSGGGRRSEERASASNPAPTPHSPPPPIGAAYLDVSTGDFFVTTYIDAGDPRLADDIARFAPREAIFPREAIVPAGDSDHGRRAVALRDRRGTRLPVASFRDAVAPRFRPGRRRSAHRRRRCGAPLRDGQPQEAARSRAVAARRQRSRLSSARRRHARQSGDPRLPRRRPPARLAVERRQRHPLGDGRPDVAQVDYPSPQGCAMPSSTGTTPSTS